MITCRERVGKYFIQLCGTTPCMVNGSEEIKKTICKHLGIEEGGNYPAKHGMTLYKVADAKPIIVFTCRDDKGRFVHVEGGGMSGRMCQRAHGANQ